MALSGRAQDVLQFFGVGGDGEIAAFGLRAAGVDLDFQIGGENVGFAVAAADQHVGKYRQGVLALDDTGNGLQRFEQAVAVGLQNQHGVSLY